MATRNNAIVVDGVFKKDGTAIKTNDDTINTTDINVHIDMNDLSKEDLMSMAGETLLIRYRARVKSGALPVPSSGSTVEIDANDIILASADRTSVKEKYRRNTEDIKKMVLAGEITPEEALERITELLK